MIASLVILAIALLVVNWQIIFGTSALVTRVIDGDTIEVLLNGKLEVVRYILVDAPELGTKAGARAKEANRKLVEGQRVTLVKDKGDKDHYGRLLRYVYANGRFINKEIFRRGHAKIMIVRPNVAKLREIQNQL